MSPFPENSASPAPASPQPSKLLHPTSYCHLSDRIRVACVLRRPGRRRRAAALTLGGGGCRMRDQETSARKHSAVATQEHHGGPSRSRSQTAVDRAQAAVAHRVHLGGRRGGRLERSRPAERGVVFLLPVYIMARSHPGSDRQIYRARRGRLASHDADRRKYLGALLLLCGSTEKLSSQVDELVEPQRLEEDHRAEILQLSGHLILEEVITRHDGDRRVAQLGD
jgi:hypothetical protein